MYLYFFHIPNVVIVEVFVWWGVGGVSVPWARAYQSHAENKYSFFQMSVPPPPSRIVNIRLTWATAQRREEVIVGQQQQTDLAGHQSMYLEHLRRMEIIVRMFSGGACSAAPGQTGWVRWGTGQMG